MTITLRPEQEKAVNEAIESGAYTSPDEVIERALQLLRAEDEWLIENRETINAKIQRGLDQFERGEYFTAEESRAEMEKRKSLAK